MIMQIYSHLLPLKLQLLYANSRMLLYDYVQAKLLLWTEIVFDRSSTSTRSHISPVDTLQSIVFNYTNNKYSHIYILN